MSNRPTYPGIIPYRSSSPSYPDAGEANMPELIKVNHNFSLRRPQSSSLMSKKFQSLSNLQKENGGGAAADLRSYKDDELRDRYFEYWAEQQVCMHVAQDIGLDTEEVVFAHQTDSENVDQGRSVFKILQPEYA